MERHGGEGVSLAWGDRGSEQQLSESEAQLFLALGGQQGFAFPGANTLPSEFLGGPPGVGGSRPHGMPPSGRGSEIRMRDRDRGPFGMRHGHAERRREPRLSQTTLRGEFLKPPSRGGSDEQNRTRKATRGPEFYFEHILDDVDRGVSMDAHVTSGLAARAYYGYYGQGDSKSVNTIGNRNKLTLTEAYAPESVDDQIAVSELVEDAPSSLESEQGRDGPWMKYARNKICRGELGDTRSMFAKHFISKRAHIVTESLQKFLEDTVDAIVGSVANTSARCTAPSRSVAPVVAAEQGADSNAQNLGRPLTLWAAKSLIPLLEIPPPSLEHKRWIDAVSPLLDVLDSLPPLSLIEENTEMIESLQQALLLPHNVFPGAEPERKRIATSTALAAALQHGSLGPLLAVVQTLLDISRNDEIASDGLRIDCGTHLEHLRQLRAKASSPNLGGIDVDGGAANNIVPKRWEVALKELGPPLGPCSMTYCDGFLYTFTQSRGMLKIGTGARGTLRGYVYAMKEHSSLWPLEGIPAAKSSLFATPPIGAKEKVSNAESGNSTPDTAHDLSITPPKREGFGGGGGSSSRNTSRPNAGACIFCWQGKLFLYSRSSMAGSRNSGGNSGDISLGTEVEPSTLTILTDNQLDVVRGKKGIVYSTIFASKTHVFALRAFAGNQLPREQRRGSKKPSSKRARKHVVVASPSVKSRVDATVWESVRNGKPFEFDVFCGDGKGDAKVKFSHNITLNGPPRDSFETQWLKTNGHIERESTMSFFAITSLDGNPVVGVAISNGTSDDTSLSRCLYFDGATGERREYVSVMPSKVSAGKARINTLNGGTALEGIRYSVNHVYVDSLEQTVFFIQTGGKMTGSEAPVFMNVCVFPLLSPPPLQGEDNSTLQAQLCSEKVAPPRETAMTILQELHRVAWLEICSSKYVVHAKPKPLSGPVYCDFHVSHIKRLSTLLSFICEWITDCVGKKKPKSDPFSLFSILRWALSLCALCMLKCADSFEDKAAKEQLTILQNILHESVRPCVKLCTQFPSLADEIKSVLVKAMYVYVPTAYFYDSKNVKRLKDDILKAFETNDLAFMTPLANEWTVEKTKDWLELVSLVLCERDSSLAFLTSLAKACLEDDVNQMSEEKKTVSRGPWLSPQLRIYLCFHKLYLSLAVPARIIGDTHEDKAGSPLVPVVYTPRNGSKSNRDAASVVYDGSCVLKSSDGFPSWGTKGLLMTKGKWYYEVEICGETVKGFPQIGWADARFRGGDGQNEGVGDDSHSWAVDGERVKCWHKEMRDPLLSRTKADNKDYGKPWKIGDRVGCAVDLENNAIIFYVNGESQGVAYENIAFAEGVYPAFTYSGRKGSNLHLRLYFGGDKDEIMYLPVGFNSVHQFARGQKDRVSKCEELLSRNPENALQDYFQTLANECRNASEVCLSRNMTRKCFGPSITMSAVLPSVLLLLYDQLSATTEERVDKIDEIRDLLEVAGLLSATLDRVCLSGSNNTNIDLVACMRTANIEPQKLPLDWTLYLQSILMLCINHWGTKLATASDAPAKVSDYWLESVLFGNGLANETTLSANDQAVEDVVQSIVAESGKGHNWIIWSRQHRPRIGMQYKLIQQSERAFLLRIEALAMAALLKHAPERVFMHSQLQVDMVAHGDAGDEDLSKSHDALQSLWTSAWSVVREARHIAQKLSEWNHLSSTSAVLNSEEKMMDFVESLNPFERLHLWACKSDESERVDHLDPNQFISRLLSCVPTQNEKDAAVKPLETVFKLIEERVSLVLALKPACWRGEKILMERQSFRKVGSTSGKTGGLKRADSLARTESLKRQGSSSASVQSLASRDWNRVVASLKRSPSGLARNGLSSVVAKDDAQNIKVDVNFYDQVSKFLRSSSYAKELRDSMSRRFEVALARCAGIGALCDALSSNSSGTSRYILLASLGRNCQFTWGATMPKALQVGVFFNGHSEGERIVVPHVRNGIRGCGVAVEAQLSSAYFDLLEQCLNVATDSAMPITTRCEALQPFGVGFLSSDLLHIQKHCFVAKLGGIVSEMRSIEGYSEGNLKLQREAWEILLLVSKAIFSASLDVKLQNELLNTLLRLLEESANESSVEGHIQYAVPKPEKKGEISTLAWNRVRRRELEVQQNIAMLYINRRMFLNTGSGVDVAKRAVRSCLKLLIHARGPYSTRTTRVTMRFLSTCLQHISPVVVAEFSESRQDVESFGDLWLPLLLLECLGAMTLGTLDLGTRNGVCSTGGSGHGKVMSLESPVKIQTLKILSDSINAAFSNFSFFGGGAYAFSESPAATPILGAENFRQEVIEIYQQYNPSEMQKAEAALLKYAGREHVLLEQLRKKYVNRASPFGAQEGSKLPTLADGEAVKHLDCTSSAATILEDEMLWDTSAAQAEWEDTMSNLSDGVREDFKLWANGPERSQVDEADVWEVVVDRMNVRRSPSMSEKPIGKPKKKGDRLEIIEKQPVPDGADYSKSGFWLKLKQPEANYSESWVLSRNKSDDLVVPYSPKTYAVMLYNPSNESPEVFMSHTHALVRMAIATDINGNGCNWPSRGWEGGEDEFIETCVQEMKEIGCGSIMRNSTKIECETVASRLACQRFVTVVRNCGGKRSMGANGGHARASVDADRNEKLADDLRKRPSSWYGGYASMSCAMEIVKMLRFLIAGIDAEHDAPGDHRARMSWAHGACRAIAKACEDFNGANASCTVSARAYGALLVLGGLANGSLHLGGRVEVITGPQTSTRGILVRYNSGEPTADVLLEGRSVVETFDIVAVHPVKAAPIPEDILFDNDALTSHVYPMLSGVLQSCSEIVMPNAAEEDVYHRRWLNASFVNASLRVLAQLQHLGFAPVVQGVHTPEMQELLARHASLDEAKFPILCTVAGDISRIEALVVDSRQHVLDLQHGFSENLVGVTDFSESDQSTKEILSMLSLPKGFSRSTAMGTVLHTSTAISSTAPVKTVQDGHLTDKARPSRPSWPKAAPSMVTADKPVPAFLDKFYFEVELRKSDNSSFTAQDISGFFVGFWVGNLAAIKPGMKNVPPDVPHSVWLHPANGKLVQSGKVREKPSFPGIEDLIIGFGDAKSIVVGCAWNLVEGSVYFTVDGAQLTPPVDETIQPCVTLSMKSTNTLVYPAVRFAGDSGLYAKINFGNNGSTFKHSICPAKICCGLNSPVLKTMENWIAHLENASKEMPDAVEGAEAEIAKVQIRGKTVSARREISDCKACIDSRKVALSLRQILAQHSLPVLMLLAQRYNMATDRAVTAAFERPEQMLELQQNVDTGEAFAQFDDYTHLEMVETEHFWAHKLVNFSENSGMIFPGLIGPSVVVNFSEDGASCTNAPDLTGKWAVVPSEKQRAPYLAQLNTIVAASVLGILWVVDTSDKISNGESNLLTEITDLSSITFDNPVILLCNEAEGVSLSSNPTVQFSFGLRPVVAPGKPEDTGSLNNGIADEVEETVDVGEFCFLLGGSSFCTSDEDAEERVAVVAAEQHASIELWLSEMHRWLVKLQALGPAEITGIIENLREGDPDGIAQMTLDSIREEGSGRSRRQPKKPIFESSSTDKTLSNAKIRVEDLRPSMHLRVTDAAQTIMHGAPAFKTGDAVKFADSASEYKVETLNADGSLSIVLAVSENRTMRLDGIHERQLVRVQSPYFRGRPVQSGSSGVKWIPDMSTCLRRTGVVRSVDVSDKDHPLVMLEFYEPETLNVHRWWFPIECLTYAAERSSVTSVSGAILYESSLSTMYARNILISGWAQTCQTSPQSLENLHVIDYVIDCCFGPVHALLERCGANAVMSSGYIAPESPVELVDVLGSRLNQLLEHDFLGKAFNETLAILGTSKTRVDFSASKMKKEVSEERRIELKANLGNLGCLLLHIGGGTAIPEGTALCIYSGKDCSQQYRLRRCQDLNAANGAEPIWCAGANCYARFEGRPKQAASKDPNGSTDPRLCCLAQQVSSKFWLGCWLIEQLLCCSVQQEDDVWITQMLSALETVVVFTTDVKCPPALSHICARLITRLLLRFSGHINGEMQPRLEPFVARMPSVLTECHETYTRETSKCTTVAGGAEHSSYLQAMTECVSTAYCLLPKHVWGGGEIPAYICSMARMIQLCTSSDSNSDLSLPRWFVRDALHTIRSEESAPATSLPATQELQDTSATSAAAATLEEDGEGGNEDDEEALMQMALMMSMQIDDNEEQIAAIKEQPQVDSKDEVDLPASEESAEATSLYEWTHESDKVLVAWYNRLMARGHLKEGRVSLEEMLSSDSSDLPLLDDFPAISDVSRRLLYLRFKIVGVLNDLYEEIIKLVDLSEFHTESLPCMLFTRRYLIFRNVKMKLWQDSIDSTAHTDRKHGLKKVKVDRVRAMNVKKTNDLSGSLFEQLRTQLTNVASWQLRPAAPTDQVLTHMCFEPDMAEEMDDGGAGGPYREVFSTLCKELHNQSVSLGLLTRRDEDGTFAMNPNGGTPLMLQMYEFLGSLLGMALRTHSLMPLDLSEHLWKSLTHESAGEMAESEHIDHVQRSPSDSEDYDIEERPPSGDVDVIVNAIHVGMSRIVPTQWLRIFTWDELKQMVGGECNVDVDLLRRHTEYHERVEEGAEYITFFWEILNEFSPEERSQFIQFAYAQPRIPGNDREWASTRTLRMRIMPPPTSKSGVPGDSVLPTAQTCFFDVHLPKYSSKEVMKRKLKLAIMC